MSSTPKNNFKELYKTKIRPALQTELKYSSIMQVPVLQKIVINMGIGDATLDAKRLESAIEELTLISGQKPVITRAKHSVANFKLREGQGIGTKVTLRGKRMYAFLERLIKVALPNVRDFRGLKRTAFDQFGNYTLGIREQIVFPEINFDHVQKIRGMDITIVTSASNRDAAYALLSAFGMPFQKSKGAN